MNKHTVLAIDIAKSIFHLVVLDRNGKEQKRRKVRRNKLIDTIVQLDADVIVMEACGGSHHWGRTLSSLKFQVELLPAQHVKSYQRGQKNDYNDALAIAEAYQHGKIRSVPIKSLEQQDEQSFHRIRKFLKQEQGDINRQIRGLLAEYGIVFHQGVSSFQKGVPLVLDAENGLTERVRELIRRQYHRYIELSEEIEWYDCQLQVQLTKDSVRQRLATIPGVGPVLASLIVMWMGGGLQFSCGREASAAIGIVPRQHTSGDKIKMSGITKKGDKYLRSILIHGARSVVSAASRKTDPLSCWINSLVARRGFNKAVVAYANKMMRMAWAILVREENYRAPVEAA